VHWEIKALEEAAMAHMFGRLSVNDYANFRSIFDAHEDMRQAAGVTGKTIYRSVDDPNEITIRLDFSTSEAAKTFASSEGLKGAIQKAEVKGPPTIWFVDET
jgi:hypothetical protein